MSIFGKFLRGLSSAPAPEIDPGSARINELCGSGRADEAERLLRRSLDRRPSPRVAQMLGTVCAIQHRYQEAIDVLRSACAPLPPDADTANLLGVCHSLVGQYEEAMRSYDTAIRMNAGLADAHLNSGLTALLMGRPDNKQRLHRWLSLRGEGLPALLTARQTAPLPLPGVTLACVDCAYHGLSAEALKASLAACAFEEALFLSDRDCRVPGVRFAGIAPIKSMAAYSDFMIRELHRHIRTEFVLVIQYDGFVLNPGAWDPAFLGYDYIGAPFRVDDGLVVGNGGFSLRSRKLLHALRDDAEISAHDAAHGVLFEDLAICGRFRQRLESAHGMRFAPADVAGRFAAGQSLPTPRCFGFHGLVQLVRLHEEGFAQPERTEDGVPIVFRAQTALGALAAHRSIELSGRADAWR